MHSRHAANVRAPALLAAGMVLVAINLRPAAAAVGPLIHQIERGTGLSSAGASLLVTFPVLCFGAMAPLAPALGRRFGPYRTITGALAALVVGLLIRLLTGIGFLFVGTLLAGAAIAVCNVMLPVLVRHDFPHRKGLVTGLYTSALVGFAALAAGLAVPIADAFAGRWRVGLGIWALPAVVALGFWLLMLAGGARGSPAGGPTLSGVRALSRDKVAWSVAIFFALQSAGFYATLTWLPSIFQSHGASPSKAGLLLSVSLVVGVLTALTVPSVAARRNDQRVLVIVFSGVMALGWLGILLAPMSAPFLWVVLLGLGQNACFPLVLMMIVLRGGTTTGTAGLSTMTQMIGYLLSATAPLLLGVVHDLTGSWTLAVVILLALVAPQAVVGLAAGRDRVVSTAASRWDPVVH